MNINADTIRLRIQSLPPHARGRRELENIAREAMHDDLYRAVRAQELENVLAREVWATPAQNGISPDTDRDSRLIGGE
ncbi:hypothetical protein ACTJJ7_16525 [Phyllobacterium sp. 22229]|uniref:hypothetical protein n=1 Tax=Phyllobacterium sp. 22229 TaxID=3453895 RepID=UPI003F8270AC